MSTREARFTLDTRRPCHLRGGESSLRWRMLLKRGFRWLVPSSSRGEESALHVIKLSLGIGVDTPQSASGLSSIAARKIFRIAAPLSHAIVFFLQCSHWCNCVGLRRSLSEKSRGRGSLTSHRTTKRWFFLSGGGRGWLGRVASSVFSGW